MLWNLLSPPVNLSISLSLCVCGFIFLYIAKFNYSFCVMYTFTSIALLNLSHIIFSAGFAYIFSLFFFTCSSSSKTGEKGWPCQLPSPQRQVSVKGWMTICCHAANLSFIDTYWKGCCQWGPFLSIIRRWV